MAIIEEQLTATERNLQLQVQIHFFYLYYCIPNQFRQTDDFIFTPRFLENSELKTHLNGKDVPRAIVIGLRRICVTTLMELDGYVNLIKIAEIRGRILFCPKLQL